MISVETNLPVYSNVGGKKTREQRKENRQTRATERRLVRQDRKAKRNAQRLIKVKRRNGKQVLVYPLIKLRAKSKFSGTNGETTIAPVIAQATEYTKTFPDGNSVIIPASQVIVHTTGIYDKNDIAKAFGVPVEQLTQQLLDAYIVGLPPASKNATSTNESTKTVTDDAGAVVPDGNVEVDANGNPYVKEELQNTNEPDKNVTDQQPGTQGGSMTKTQKYIFIGVGVLAVGVIAYVLLNKKGGGK